MIVKETSANLSSATGSRSRLLNAAIADVRKWCVPSSEMVDGNRHPDTYWIELFDAINSSEITEWNAHQFLITFKLANRLTWNKAALAALISEIRSSATLEPAVSIPVLAYKLRDCNHRKTRQTSAASKIAFFAKPRATIFIWDSLASRSARLRDWLREPQGKKRASSSVYTDGNGEHDYPSFFGACERALADERSSSDFNNAVDLLEKEFRRGPGVMADRSKIPREFIEHRLLDKLMYWEGWSLKNKKLPN